MGVPRITMAFVPYARGYGYPYYGYGHDHFGYHPYGAYGPTLEEVKKIREADEKAFQDAEDKRKELIEAERKQYEEYVEAQKKAVEDAVAKEKEFYEKERELVKKLGGENKQNKALLTIHYSLLMLGYPYAFGGAYGYGHPGYGAHGAGYGAYGAYGGYGRGYGYP